LDFIDKNGDIVINPQFEDIGGFGNALAPVKSDGKWGFIDKDAYSYFDKLAAVKFEGKWGYVDKEGKYVINPQFDEAGNFEDGLAAVRVGERWGYIDPKGTYVWNPTSWPERRFGGAGHVACSKSVVMI
jgi:hypothetical protein